MWIAQSKVVIPGGEASIGDSQIKELCKGIVTGQQSEIDLMKAILARSGQ